MGLKMGSFWCEILIKSTLTKRLLWTITLFCVGLCGSGTSSVMFFQSPGVKAETPPFSPKMVEGSTDQVKLNLNQVSPFHQRKQGAESKEQRVGREKSSENNQGYFWDRSSINNPENLNQTPSTKRMFLEQLLALIPDSFSHLTHQTFLQAQNPPVPSEILQPNPNEDRFPQPAPTPEPIPDSEETEPVQPPPPPSESTDTDSPTTLIKKIEVIGSTVFTPEQLNAITKPFEGRSLTLKQLREVADKITQLYLERGYITSRAILVDQPIEEGIVEIRILEGSLEEIKIEGNTRLNPDYIRSRVQLGAGIPLNTADLEDQLRLLRTDPLFENIEASLRSGSQQGKSILIVRIAETDPFEGSVSIDNYSPPSVGSERLGLRLAYLNLTGNGDRIATSFYHTTRSGSDIGDISYRLPVNPMNGTIQLRTSLNRNEVVESGFSFFDIQGESQLYEASFRQPFVRTPREEFALSLGFAYQRSKALLGDILPVSPGANSEGVTTTSVIKFGQDYLRRDARGAWSLRSLFSFGTDLFNATDNPEPTPDGQFISWLGQIQRVQVLNENNLLIIGADIQLTPDTLVPSQQFVIGGGQSLRGYRQNIRAGDNGFRFSLEDRITLERDEGGIATFQLAPFFDAGLVWNDSDNPNLLPDQRFLAGVGLGIIWQPIPHLNLRLDYGVPLIDLDDRGTNAQDEGFYFSVNYDF